MTKANTLSNEVKYSFSPSKTLNPYDYIRPILKSSSQKIDSRILFVDINNIVKADSSSVYIGQEFYHKEIKQALNNNSVHGLYNFKKFGHVLYTATSVKFEKNVIGAILISTSVNDIYEDVGEINKKLMLISITSIIFIALLGFIFASFLSNPIEKFTKAITRISQGKLNQRVEINTRDEFHKMAVAFNLMLNKLNQVDKQRKDFVANVSHELRTPLSSMKLLSESLIHQEESNIDIYIEFMKDINSEVNRLNNIIDDLLALVDMDKEKLNLNYQPTYINFLLEKIVGRLKPLAEEKSISLDLVLEEEIQTNMDSDKIQQAMINIIHNAIKYTPEGGKVLVKLYTDGKFAVVEIKDNGIGMDKEDLEHIFDRFYRVDKARARNTGGTGLGLSIGYEIVSLHQGTIEVESEVGKGSTFYIKLPNNIVIE